MSFVVQFKLKFSDETAIVKLTIQLITPADIIFI